MGGKSGRTVRYLARGDTVKLAHRLCSEADLGEVLVSDKVAAMASHRFRFSPGPVLRRKGRREEHKSFMLHGARDRVDPVTGRWVPREDEMERLGRVIGRLAEGHGGVVSITGGAGVGKSRVLQLRDWLEHAAFPSCWLARDRTEAIAPLMSSEMSPLLPWVRQGGQPRGREVAAPSPRATGHLRR